MILHFVTLPSLISLKFARDSRTACEWQSFVSKYLTLSDIQTPSNKCITDNQAKMMSAFKAAMLKLSVLGNDINNMVDCSEVIPVPPTFNKAATFPAGLTIADVEQAVSESQM